MPGIAIRSVCYTLSISEMRRQTRCDSLFTADVVFVELLGFVFSFFLILSFLCRAVD